jgi:hypothetical protein
VAKLLTQMSISKNLIGFVAIPALTDQGDVTSNRSFSGALGMASQLDEIVRIYQINELIFCSKDIRSQDIMAWMTRLGPAISYKIVPEESLSIIGSSSKDEPGELYTIDIKYNIAQPVERRSKRMLDISVCLALLLSLPLWLLISRKRSILLKNWWQVLSSQKTWVGYAANEQNQSLPKLKPSVFSPLDGLGNIYPNDATTARLNFLFAKDWDTGRDWGVLMSAFRA